MKSFKLIATAFAAACAATSSFATAPVATIYSDTNQFLPGILTSNHESQIIHYELIDNFYVGTIYDTDFNNTHTVYMPTESVMYGSIEEIKDTNGEWISNEHLFEYPIHPVFIIYWGDQIQYGNGKLTQTFFNSDDSYEYIMPIIKVISDTKITSTDQDGNPNRITTDYTRWATGFNIMSENGTTLHTIELPEKMDGYGFGCNLIQLNKKKYLCVYGYTQREGDRKYAHLYYHIPSDDSKLELVRYDEGNLQTTQNGKNLIISFDGDSNYDNIEIFDASGRKALGRNIDSTANEASVNISDLSQGTYILRATSQSGEKISCKIAIR